MAVMTPAQHLDALHRTRDLVGDLFRQDEVLLARPYAPGRWTGRQVLIHIADTESVLMDRLRRILAEDEALLAAFDQDAWTRRLAGAWRPLGGAATLFQACRATSISLVAAMTADDWMRTGRHSARGPEGVERVVTMIHGHAEHHAAQVRASLLGEVWKP